MSELNTEKVFLGSIFHDIGKFYQRAKDKNLKEKLISEYEYHIKQSNSYAPRHQEYGAYFYKNSKLPYSDDIEGVILNHHNPINLLSKLVKIADHISANERSQNESEEKIKNMKSILSIVSFEEKRNGKYRKISKLSDFEDLLEKEEENVENSYQKLWDEFERVIKSLSDEFNNKYKAIPPKIDSKFYEKIYYVLKEYTSNVPSAFYYSEPEISLFSHLSTTAAIAVSIFKELEEALQSGNESILENLNDKKILGIIKGDISGIQNFIYNVSQEHAVKKLRGRSFYLSYLLEIIARYILKSEGLSIANVLYNGGGHFYLLVPAKTIDRLEIYQKKIDEIMFNAHGIDLAVNLFGEKITPQELNEDIYGRISKKMEIKKYRKFSTLSYEKLFEIKNVSRNVCPYCKREMKNDECEFCESFAFLGDRLVKSKSFKLEEYNKEINSIKTVNDIFKAFGFDIVFSDIVEKDSYAIDKENVDLTKCMFYIKSANYVLKDEEGKVSDLEKIAERSKGIKRWGVLRGDVDNLGRIFGEGLGKNPPISKKVSLSQEIEVFFGKFLEDLVKSKTPNCSVIYSGGDDFFILGPWSDLPVIAEVISDEFKRYSGYNPYISVTMSIEVSPAKKYPVFRVANVSGENLDKAKEYKRKNGKSKDALYFFGDIIGWEEFNEYSEKKLLMKQLIDKGVTKRFIYVLRNLFEEYISLNNGYFKVWRIYYYFSRLSERYKNARELIMELLNKILCEDNKLYKHIYSLTYWVEYEKREG
ncbi:MAG: CRISPR-associated protein Csm1 [Thermosipho sp. (in: thermotogales)]|jgi:CRISPR-associated protein Csm1|nr:CRISPR-associated protein Csm1 [Thermosipho sp. (in: thermotogales)]